jgi:hypothetical protein
MRRLALRIALFIRFELRQCPMAPGERNPGWPMRDELPACVVGNGVKQAMGSGEMKASGGLGLLRMWYPPADEI